MLVTMAKIYFCHLQMLDLTETAITFSTATVTRDTEDSNQPMDDFPAVYSDVDTGVLLNEGNDTAFQPNV